jgi:hypothetical protein
MGTERDTSIDMTTDELATMMDERNVEGFLLSATARAALVSAAPNPGGVRAAWFICPLHIARKLLAWAQAGETRWKGVRPSKSKLFQAGSKFASGYGRSARVPRRDNPGTL